MQNQESAIRNPQSAIESLPDPFADLGPDPFAIAPRAITQSAATEAPLSARRGAVGEVLTAATTAAALATPIEHALATIECDSNPQSEIANPQSEIPRVALPALPADTKYIYQLGVPARTYHAWPALGSTMIRNFRRSPDHMRYELEHPGQTESQLQGDGIHCAILQPDVFEQQYVGAPKVNRSTTKGKETDKEFRQQHAGKTILKYDDYELCLTLRDLFYTSKACDHIFESDREVSIAYLHPDYGFPCKARLDSYREFDGVLVDLKSTSHGMPWQFSKSIFDYGYYIQGAWYIDSARAIGRQVNEYRIIAIEKTGAMGVRTYRLSQRAIDLGRKEIEDALPFYAACLESDTWPSYAEAVEEIDLPEFAYRRATAALMA